MTTQELIETTKQLIALPTTQDNPAALRQAIDFVATLVQAPGVTVERFERNGKPSLLAYRGAVRPERFDILLNGHIDVVPAKPEQFVPREQDGKLYGRGALDMKGTTVVLADAFSQLVQEVPYNLGLQIVSDEEIGGYDGVHYQIGQSVSANFVIMGEYANDRHTIYIAARGLCWAEIKFSGRTAHGGHLWHGSNALLKAGDFANAVLKHYPTPDKETWTTTASIASLSTPNDAYNRVPDSAILKIDFRFTQEDPVFRTKESVRAFIASIDPEAELIDLATFEPAVHVEQSNPYVQGLAAALQRVTHVPPQFLGRPASSDGRHFALINNDIVEFGLYGQHPHSDNEYVELASFGEYQAILHAFLREPVPAQPARPAAAREPLPERLLRTLVDMPTTSVNPGVINGALTFVEDFLRARGMSIEYFEQNGHRSLIATTRPGNKRPAVLLNAHIDVVPAPESASKLTVKNGKLYGRGVMDMKHAVAAYLSVADALQGQPDAYDFGILITSDEELGGQNGAKPLVQQEGYRPGVVIVPDGGNNWELETFAKGVYWVELNTSGKRGHASRPWEGDSAIRRLLGALKEIEALTPAHPKPTDTFLSVGTITGGTTANQIPANASAMLDIRTGSVKDHHRLLAQIQAICKAHGVTATVRVNDPPCVSDPKDPYIKPMVEIVERITGKAHQTSYDYGVTDGRFFNAVGVPTIVINPECGGGHTDEEWLSRAGLSQFCEVIEAYVRRMARVHDSPKSQSALSARLVAPSTHHNEERETAATSS